MSPDGRLALSAGERGALRLWLLDWEPDQREGEADWDERARPFLDGFLRRVSDGGGPLAWSEGDLAALMAELARRGFGWLRPRRVARELEVMAASWDERRTLEQREDDLAQLRQERRRRAEPVATLLRALTRGIGLNLALLSVLAVGAVATYQCLRVPSATRVELSEPARGAALQRFLARSESLRTPGLSRSFHARPTAGDAGPCTREEGATYLDVVLRPDGFTRRPLDPEQESPDAPFRRLYRRAVACLPPILDRDSVPELLSAAVAAPAQVREDDLLAVLVKAGEPALPALAEALGEGEGAVRQAAATVLLYQGSPGARRLLLGALAGADPAAAAAAATLLRELIGSGAVEADQAFELLSRLAHSIDPGVRREAISCLSMFRPAEAVEELLRGAQEDSDPAVRQEAATTRGLIRDLRRQELLGRRRPPRRRDAADDVG